jgi:hypothetical protein
LDLTKWDRVGRDTVSAADNSTRASAEKEMGISPEQAEPIDNSSRQQHPIKSEPKLHVQQTVSW